MPRNGLIMRLRPFPQCRYPMPLNSPTTLSTTLRERSLEPGGFLRKRFPDPSPGFGERNEIPGLVRCTRCKVGKSPAEFRKNARKRNGLSSWCAACHTAATAAWREANPGQVEAYNVARRAPVSPEPPR